VRAYKLKNFDPKKFRFNDYKEATAIIFKDMLFDEKRLTAMIHLIVSEEHLIQHFWVTITHQKEAWIVAKAEGQNFFPTPGIAKAIELVFQSAQATCV